MKLHCDCSQIPPTPIEIATEEEVSAHVPFHIQKHFHCKTAPDAHVYLYNGHFLSVASKTYSGFTLLGISHYPPACE